MTLGKSFRMAMLKAAVSARSSLNVNASSLNAKRYQSSLIVVNALKKAFYSTKAAETIKEESHLNSSSKNSKFIPGRMVIGKRFVSRVKVNFYRIQMQSLPTSICKANVKTCL